jgi:hypothetical protein
MGQQPGSTLGTGRMLAIGLETERRRGREVVGWWWRSFLASAPREEQSSSLG